MKEKSKYEEIVAGNIKNEMVSDYIQYIEEYSDASYEEIAEFIVAIVEKYCAGQPEDIINLVKMWSTGFFAGAIYMKYYKDTETIVT